MAIKATEDILQPDPRFANLSIAEDGKLRRMTLADHHAAVANICLSAVTPTDVAAAFDRARSAIIYAFFDYELLVVGEVLALGAFELALKHRLIGHGGATRGTLRNLVDKARKIGILPASVPNPTELPDPIEALIALRNGLAHGTSDIHEPAMALGVITACASWIDHIFRS